RRTTCRDVDEATGHPYGPRMKTVLLFPGLDALFLASKLKRWLINPTISVALNEASTARSRLTHQSEDLVIILEKFIRHHIADFDRTLVALTALQVGIARALAEKVSWDLVLGCSHGDIARSVVCEVVSFADAVDILWLFAELRKSCPKGGTA